MNNLNTMHLPVSEGYILVDSKRCQGCQACMIACSMVHHGEANLSLARLQVMQDILKNWPDDIKIVQCRQCVEAGCIEACPTGALHIDSENGNIRVIDESECIGCQACIDACPFTPQRIVWDPLTERAFKCDLCLDTPYWEETGGIGGRQICVEVCPARVIKFTTDVPDQSTDDGYDLDLNEGVLG